MSGGTVLPPKIQIPLTTPNNVGATIVERISVLVGTIVDESWAHSEASPTDTS